jgi:hypothetical protein
VIESLKMEFLRAFFDSGEDEELDEEDINILKNIFQIFCGFSCLLCVLVFIESIGIFITAGVLGADERGLFALRLIYALFLIGKLVWFINLNLKLYFVKTVKKINSFIKSYIVSIYVVIIIEIIILIICYVFLTGKNII